MTLPWPEKQVPFHRRLAEIDAPLEDSQFSDVRHIIWSSLHELSVEDDAGFVAGLGATELGGNAQRLNILLRIVIGLCVESSDITVCIQDTMPGWTSEGDRQPTGHNDQDEFGRGTDIIEILATDYGYKPLVSLVKGHPEPPGKTVWFTLPYEQPTSGDFPEDLAA